MATVVYSCNTCDEFWCQGGLLKCPKCGSEDIITEWDEAHEIEEKEQEE